MTIKLTKPQARRIALAAQQIGRPRPSKVGLRQVQGVIDALAQFQIDSVNVLARAHLMPLFSRLGPYDTGLLTRAAEESPRRLFEFFGHAASLIDTRLAPALAFRMLEHRQYPWKAMQRLLDKYPQLPDELKQQIADRGPLTARQLAPEGKVNASKWWGWSDTKAALEWLFYTGELSAAGRNSAFERRYDLIERVLPDMTALDASEAQRELVRSAAKALGVGSLRCLADYFRLPMSRTRGIIEQLVATGELVPASVEGWGDPVWLWHEARQPRSIAAATVLAPFDPVVFERNRLLALFDMHYRIEIYVPAPKRQYGYYVYPFLYNDSIDARFDLKADRQTGTLLVQASWIEDHAQSRKADVAAAASSHFETLAAWLSLSRIEIVDRGSLAPEMRHMAD